MPRFYFIICTIYNVYNNALNMYIWTKWYISLSNCYYLYTGKNYGLQYKNGTVIDIKMTSGSNNKMLCINTTRTIIILLSYCLNGITGSKKLFLTKYSPSRSGICICFTRSFHSIKYLSIQQRKVSALQ